VGPPTLLFGLSGSTAIGHEPSPQKLEPLAQSSFESFVNSSSYIQKQ
jgi:hypothetical protein